MSQQTPAVPQPQERPEEPAPAPKPRARSARSTRVSLEEVKHAGHRFWLAWLGLALAASALNWIRPRYLPAQGLPPIHGESLGMPWLHLHDGLHAEWVGLGLLGLGMLAVLFTGLRQRRFGLGLGLALAVGVSMPLADQVFAWLETVVQPVLVPFAYVAWGVLEAAGQPATIENGRLLVQDAQGAFSFAPFMGSVGLRTLALFWVAGALLISVRERGQRVSALIALFYVPLVLFALRYALQVLVMVGTDDALASVAERTAVVSGFWGNGSLLVTLLASAICVAAVSGRARWEPEATQAWMPVGLIGLTCGAAFGGAFVWTDPGTAKQGRVLVDDRLTGYWEPAGRLLDTERYGDFSAYSLSAMVEHLARRFTVEVNGHRRYTRDYLDRFDVLVLKTPEMPLDDEEIGAIQDWVQDGGGLFAISDHTDLLGMSTYLNRLLQPFGMHFRFDSTSFVPTGGFDYWGGNPNRYGPLGRVEPLVAEHPVSAGLGVFECMTPCSIGLGPLDGLSAESPMRIRGAGRLGSWLEPLFQGPRPVMTMLQSGSTGGDYANSSNFGTLAPDGSRPHGMLLLSAAAEPGKGRVLTFSDSTVLSSFSYYMWSHADYVARGVAWLNHEESNLVWLGPGLLLLGIVSLLFGLVRSRGVGPGGFAAWCVLFSLGFAGGAWALTHSQSQAVAVPEATEDAIRVGFVIEGGTAILPAALGNQPDMPDDWHYTTFVQTPQRLGYETRVITRDADELADIDVLVMLNPGVEGLEDRTGNPHANDAPDGWIDAVDQWVREGGRLVAMARDAHWDHGHARAREYLDGDDLNWRPFESPAPGIRMEVANKGKGRVVAVRGSENFCTERMGHCMAYPGRDERLRYNAAFQIFGPMLELQNPERRCYRPY